MMRKNLGRKLVLAAAGAIGLTMIGSQGARGADAPWPTIHHDNQRSGYVEQAIAGPYERKWFRGFYEELIATRVEAIIADGKCFVGTMAGNLYALDVATGATTWSYHASAPIGASACYADGRIYFGADDGYLYCLSAADGKELWKYRAAGGIWVAPCSDAKAVYFGDRAGVFHAVAADSGKKLWTCATDGMILTAASIGEDGSRIIFGSEDMHLYCLDTSGKVLWKSSKLGGLSLRDHAPTIWKGLAIVRTNPSNGFHHAAGENPAILNAAQKALPNEDGDKVMFDKWGTFVMKSTPRRLEAERAAIVKFLAANPAEKSFYAFDLQTGKEPWTAPVLYTAGLHNPATPPTFNPKTGELFTWAPTALSAWAAGVPGGAIAVGKLDAKTGLVDFLTQASGEYGSARSFAQPADETQSLSLMGDILINTHQGMLGGLNIQTYKWQPVYQARDSYGGVYGPAFIPNAWQGGQQKAEKEGKVVVLASEWHGPDRAIVSIGENRIFWVVGAQVVCIGGPNTSKTETGGTKPPAEPLMWKTPRVVPGGNVVNGGMGGFDASIAKPKITAEQIRKYLAAPARPAGVDNALRAKLDASVAELIGADLWAPFIIELGCAGEERHFWRTAETMQALALALPHLSPETRTKARVYLTRMFNDGCPLTSPVFPGKGGQRREAYDLGREMLNFANATPTYKATVEDLYALWAYANYAGTGASGDDAWKQVAGKLKDIKAIFDDYAKKPVQFDPNDKDNDAAAHLNAQIAGTLAYARIMSEFDNTAEADRAVDRLVELVTIRIQYELADTNYIHSSKVASHNLHQAKIPRYDMLTPEVGQMLHDFAGDATKKSASLLAEQLPLWYQAFGERMIGGENYISTPTLADGLFLALADGAQIDPAVLAAKLDQPWCKADIYYIQKLTALLSHESSAQ